MLRNASWVIALLAVTAIAGWSRGGWAVVTVDSVPEYVEAGKPFTLTWAIRAHGQRLVGRSDARITAARTVSSSTLAARDRWQETAFLTPAGSERGPEISFPAIAEPERGFHSATVTLPSPGDWTLTIWANHGHRLAPIKVVDAGAHPSPRSLTERGARLFVAAGCVSCHTHGDIAQRVLMPVGPDLTSLSHTDEYLAAVLRDPDSVLAYDEPALGWSERRMPDLGLDEPEIEALVAFLKAESPVRLSFVAGPARPPNRQAPASGPFRRP